MKEKKRSGQQYWEIRERLTSTPKAGIWENGPWHLSGLKGMLALVVHPSFSLGKELEEIGGIVKIFSL